MTPSKTGALMKRARKLLRLGRLTKAQFVLLDCMVWSCRTPGSDRLTASYTRLAKLAQQARSTVAAGIAVLTRLGLLGKIKRRVRVVWGAGIASRQATNIYRLLVPDTEFDEAPALRGQQEKTPLPTVVHRGKKDALEEALARLGVSLGVG